MFCHRCENEWYRDEHGLTCPECHSDFTEIVEPQHDPRTESLHAEPSSPDTHSHSVEDPDEADIDNISWIPNTSSGHPNRSFGGGYYRDDQGHGNWQQDHQQSRHQQNTGGGLLGFIGSMLPGFLGQGQFESSQPPAPAASNVHDSADNRSGSQFDSNSEQEERGTRVRHFQGPGYNVTIATSSSGNLFPRNAHEPQPFQSQPDDIQNMMHQMLFNIGAHSGGGIRLGGSTVQGFRTTPHSVPFGHIFQMLGVPFGLGDAHGDAVFSQEALDRVITQLMEQHQSGNAPGPASSEAIAALPQRAISEKDFVDSNRAECSICMDAVDIGTMVTELPCHHWFHHDCIGAWLGEHDTCPHCRRGITPMDDPGTNRPRQPSQAPLHDAHAFGHGPVPGGFPSSAPQNHDTQWRE